MDGSYWKIMESHGSEHHMDDLGLTVAMESSIWYAHMDNKTIWRYQLDNLGSLFINYIGGYSSTTLGILMKHTGDVNQYNWENWHDSINTSEPTNMHNKRSGFDIPPCGSFMIFLVFECVQQLKHPSAHQSLAVSFSECDTFVDYPSGVRNPIWDGWFIKRTSSSTPFDVNLAT